MKKASFLCPNRSTAGLWVSVRAQGWIEDGDVRDERHFVIFLHRLGRLAVHFSGFGIEVRLVRLVGVKNGCSRLWDMVSLVNSNSKYTSNTLAARKWKFYIPAFVSRIN